MSAPSTPRASHALFPGVFDPFHHGHLDLVRRAARLFGRVTVGVAQNPEKQPMLGAEQRAELVRECVTGIAGVEVRLVAGLVVHACEELGADVIVRGLRGGGDYDYEAAMARTNRTLLARIDTVLLAPAPEHTHVSSTLVRHIASLGGDASGLVPPPVARALRERFPPRPA